MPEFEATFATPSVGTFALPLPIAGNGQLVLDESGLKLRGFLPSPRASGCLSLLPSILGCAAIMAIPMYFLGPEAYQTSPLRYVALGVSVAVVGPQIRKTLSVEKNSDATEQPVTWSIELKDIKRVAKNGQTAGQICLVLSGAVSEKAKKGKSEVLFNAAQSEEFCEALKALGVKV